MNMQNENLLFTSMCRLFYRTLLELREGTVFLNEPKTVEAMELFEEWLEDSMRNRTFERWNKRLISPVEKYYADVRQRKRMAIFSESEDLKVNPGDEVLKIVSEDVDKEWDSGVFIKVSRSCLMLDFCFFLSGNSGKIQKVIERQRRNDLAAMAAAGRYLFVVEFREIDFQLGCNRILEWFPELEYITVGRYPGEVFYDGEWVKKLLPAGVYLFRVQDNIL